MTQLSFRRARGDESDLLNEMTLAGLRHWGHHESHPALYNSLADDLPGAEDIVNNPVNVLERDGEVIAFYEMRDRGDHVELLRMFQKVELIGQGYGRMMWDHCVQEARQMGPGRMRIISDPEAVGFYETMGAALERAQEVAPGFSLGLFWYDLG